jgi:hypothetical protein
MPRGLDRTDLNTSDTNYLHGNPVPPDNPSENSNPVTWPTPNPAHFGNAVTWPTPNPAHFGNSVTWQPSPTHFGNVNPKMAHD